MAVDLGGPGLWLLGPPRLRPRPTWQGGLEEARVRLATVADDAGPEGFWAAFTA